MLVEAFRQVRGFSCVIQSTLFVVQRIDPATSISKLIHKLEKYGAFISFKKSALNPAKMARDDRVSLTSSFTEAIALSLKLSLGAGRDSSKNHNTPLESFGSINLRIILIGIPPCFTNASWNSFSE